MFVRHKNIRLKNIEKYLRKKGGRDKKSIFNHKPTRR